jgi:glucans biosynthesis protein
VPGDPTVVEVTAHLYPRRAVDKLGLAPLTSMFLFGEARLRHFSDYRPEVHDSDGLLVASASGEWIWRPLQNPKDAHRVTRLSLADPQGFGLLQRDRSFASYEDLEARYERRPGYWVTPDGAWGAGAVELVEIPSDSEGNDNVAAYWVPDEAPARGAELTVRYTLTASLDDPPRPPLARVRDTRIRPGAAADLFVLDFDAPAASEDSGEVRAEVSGAGVRNVVLQENAPEEGLRCTFEVSGKTDDGELRVRLLRDDRPASETWVLPWQRP